MLMSCKALNPSEAFCTTTVILFSDVTKIQNGIGDKVGMVIQSSTMFLTGFLIGFSYSWKLTLVILSITPALIFTGAITGKVCPKLSICFFFQRGML